MFNERPAAEHLPWPMSGLDVQELQRSGWRSAAFNEFVVKIHSRCNLACDYCYVYEMEDQSWREQPKTMRRDIFDASCHMIAEHVQRFAIPDVQIVFHGGEPLMAGHAEFEYFARTAREVLEPSTEVRLGVQTNGVLIDQEFLRISDRWDIRIGISLDGTRSGNDRHRLDRRGGGTYDRVVAGLDRLLIPEWRHLFSGLLCAIDLDNDPIETYGALLQFQPPAIDLLLPHANWMSQPPGRSAGGSATAYADWLIAVFDRWYDATELETSVRLFDNIIDVLLGGHPASEAIGLTPIRLAVIETDGSLEQVDELKSAFQGATKLSIRGGGNALDMALQEPGVVARQIGIDALCDVCRSCALHTVCGGGHYVHRYRDDTGFRNPSVYCVDLKKLIGHIESRIRADIPTLPIGRRP